MPPALPSPYATLAVAPTATLAQIKKSYRRLMLRWHPDRNPADVARATERTKEITAAYTAIGTPAARAAYDERERLARVARDVRAWQARQPAPRARPRRRTREAPRPEPPRPAPRPAPRRPVPPPPVGFTPDDINGFAGFVSPRPRRPVRYAGFDEFAIPFGGDPVTGAGAYPDEGRIYGEPIFEGSGTGSGSGDGIPEEDYAAEGGAVDWEDDGA